MRRNLLQGILFAAAGALTATAAAGPQDDRKVTPPPVRAFPSPSGKFTLEIHPAAGQPSWKSHVAEAELFATDKSGTRRHLVWRQTLEQRYGPALALVTDQGVVVLLDEWVKTPSQFAVALLASSTGAVIARHPMAGIAAVAEVSQSKLIKTANFGTWMSASPRLEGNAVMLEAAGVPLRLDLVTGSVTAAAK